MHTALFLGLTTVDLVYLLPRHPAANEKLKAQGQLTFAGGPATNAAIAFAAMGGSATLVTSLGTHLLAFLAKEDIQDARVHLIDAAADPDQPPVLASILLDTRTGERAVVSCGSDGRSLLPDVFTPHLLDKTDLLMLDGYYLPQALQMAAWAKKRNIPVVLDGGSWKPGLESLLPLVNYAICSANFLPQGCSQSSEVVRTLQHFGIPHIAISRGGASILATSGDDTIELPVPQVKPVDTLGAGDILHGAFCHYLLEHPDFPQSLQQAAIIASHSCTAIGTRAWIQGLRRD